MIEKILKAEAWHVFALIFGVPFSIFIVMYAMMSISINSDNEVLDFIMNIVSHFGPIAILMSIVSALAWMYAVGVGLNSKLNEKLKVDTQWFKLSFIPIIVFIICLGLVYKQMGSASYSTEGHSHSFLSTLGSFIQIIMILFFVSAIYLSGFVAKILKKAFNQYGYPNNSFSIGFLLTLPFTIWQTQPIINKIMEK